MRVRTLAVLAAIAALLTVALTSCQKNEQEARKFPRSDSDEFLREFGQMASFTLDNGITVYLQEEYTVDQVALEVFYRAGFVQEPKGQVQVAHVAEHALVFAPTESYEAGAGPKVLGKTSRIAAEAVADYVHFDYVVVSDLFEELLKIESEHYKSPRFDPDVVAEQAKKAAKEIDTILTSDRGTMRKFALMSFLQALQYGETFVPIKQANFDRTPEEIEAFHNTYYRPQDMIIVVVGAIKTDEARALIEKYFGDIERRPEPPRREFEFKDMSVRWDIDCKAVFLAYPPPAPEAQRDRIALTAFGSYLHQYIARDLENVATLTHSTYTTNPSHPLINLPFFVFAQTAEFRSQAEVRDLMMRMTDEAVSTLDEVMFDRIKGSLTKFVTSSFLEAMADNYRIDHHVVIGQHAVNTGIQHMLREGLSTDEYVAIIESLTFEDMQQVLATYLAPEKRSVVMISK